MKKQWLFLFSVLSMFLFQECTTPEPSTEAPPLKIVVSCDDCLEAPNLSPSSIQYLQDLVAYEQYPDTFDIMDSLNYKIEPGLCFFAAFSKMLADNQDRKGSTLLTGLAFDQVDGETDYWLSNMVGVQSCVPKATLIKLWGGIFAEEMFARYAGKEKAAFVGNKKHLLIFYDNYSKAQQDMLNSFLAEVESITNSRF